MTQIVLKLANRRRIAFDVAPGLEGPPGFVLSVRKSGSTILNRICAAVAEFNGRPFVDVGDTFFWKNVDVSQYVNDPALLKLVRRGNVYGGFRNMPKALMTSEMFRAAPKLLMVRDPRDALVSEFFSNAYSHPIPPASSAGDRVTRLLLRQRRAALQAGIDKTVIARAGSMAATMLEYAPIVGAAGTTILKYEDCILDKRALIGVIARTFGWRIDVRQVRGILSWADVRPRREDPASFIRKVTPGDHRAKLKPETIAIINQALGPAMKLFRYRR